MLDKVAPVRFIIFAVIFIACGALFVPAWHVVKGILAAFDVASLIFLLLHLPLLNDKAGEMREHSRKNDANRAVLLGISVAVTTVVLVAVGATISGADALHILDIALIIATLSLAWLFGNVIYGLHYAHIYYLAGKGGKGDSGGIEFPGTKEPGYWDFLYFAFTLGMTFQTSDCDITSQPIRRVAVGHCIAAFVYNLGVLAFTINALGS